MARSRMLALALLPLLVAGAAACGRGGDEVPADPTAAADAAFAAMGEDPATWPSCGQWRDASDWWRSGIADGVALGSRSHQPVTSAEVEAGIDRACSLLPDDESMASGMFAFALGSIDMNQAFAEMLGELEDSSR